MRGISGSMEHYFDDSLKALLQQFERTLPCVDNCEKEYVDWEKENYDRLCLYLLREMVERAERVCAVWLKRLEMYESETLSRGSYEEVSRRLGKQMPLMEKEGKELIARLVEAMGKMVNIGLTDEETEQKWLLLERKVQYVPKMPFASYSELYVQFRESGMGKKEFFRQILAKGCSIEEMVGFMINCQSSGKVVRYDTVEVRDTLVFKPVKENFICKWKERDMYRVNNLYNELRELGWIERKTDDMLFRTLFSGRDGILTITWTGAARDLRYLFIRLKEEGVISCPPGVGHWQIVSSKFVNKEGKRFTDLNKGEEPKKNREKIEAMVRRMVDDE